MRDIQAPSLIRFQLYLLLGRGRPAGDHNRRPVGVDHLHRRLLAVGQCPVHAVRVLQGCLHWGLRLHLDRPVRGSLFRHCQSTQEILCAG